MRQLAVSFSILVAICTFHSAHGANPDPSSNFDVIQSTDGRITSYRKWTERNVSIVDWNNPIRNQGAVGSCQSFAFLGMMENEVFQKQGVTVNLSVRYALYSNFMEFGALGSDPAQIKQFPVSFAKWGALPESLYPYSAVNQNAAVFELDSAQGLQNGTEPLINQAISGKADNERSLILQQSQFFGQLPAGNYPIQLPVMALKVDVQRPQRFVLDIRQNLEVPCFSENGSDNKVSLSPSEFATHCLEHHAEEFYTDSPFDLLVAQSIGEICKSSVAKQALADSMVDARSSALAKVLKNLSLGQPSLIAFAVPQTLAGKKSVIWPNEGNSTYAGHATLALGFLTKDDLLSIQNQSAGLLGTGLFDELASTFDANYIKPSQMDTDETKASLRKNSQFGQIIIKEQGVVLFRNSWGDVPGRNGYQTMTFDYFLANAILAMSKKSNAIELGNAPLVITNQAIKAGAQAFVGQYCH